MNATAAMRAPSTRGLRSPHPAARLVPLAIALTLAAACTLLAARDAVSRREVRERGRAVRTTAAVLAGPEIALHSASRWLRHPTRSEPWSASADGPALLDLDPAGALAPPPAEVLRAGLPVTRLTLHRGRR